MTGLHLGAEVSVMLLCRGLPRLPGSPFGIDSFSIAWEAPPLFAFGPALQRGGGQAKQAWNREMDELKQVLVNKEGAQNVLSLTH